MRYTQHLGHTGIRICPRDGETQIHVRARTRSQLKARSRFYTPSSPFTYRYIHTHVYIYICIIGRPYNGHLPLPKNGQKVRIIVYVRCTETLTCVVYVCRAHFSYSWENGHVSISGHRLNAAFYLSYMHYNTSSNTLVRTYNILPVVIFPSN